MTLSRLPVTSQVHLQALDLHWNKIDAGDASAIFQGCPPENAGSGAIRYPMEGSNWEQSFMHDPVAKELRIELPNHMILVDDIH